MNRKNYEKSGMSENMFLKTYKKISRFVRSVFAKKTKMWTKITIKSDFSPRPIIFDVINLLTSKNILRLNYLGFLEKIVLGERILKMGISSKDEFYRVKIE